MPTYHIPTPKTAKSKSPPPIPPTQLILPPPLLSSTPHPIKEDQPDPEAVKLLSKEELLANTAIPLSKTMIIKLHANSDNIPDIRLCNTPAPCGNRTTFDNLKLHKTFGCWWFRNQQHFASSSANEKLISTGELPSNLGLFATIPNPLAGKVSQCQQKLLDKVQMDIVFGNCLSLEGFDTTSYWWTSPLDNAGSTA